MRASLRVAVLFLLLLPTAASWALLAARVADARPVRLTREGLALEILAKRWVHDVMQHGEGGFAMPQAMVPGMPAAGEQRLSLELRLYVEGASPRTFDPGELWLLSRSGERREPSQVEIPPTTLRPRQSLLTSVAFDVPEGGDRWELRWGEERVLATRAPMPAPSPEAKTWPERAEEIAAGDATRGAELYTVRFACASCHADPRLRAAGAIGPSLYEIGQVAAGRVPGKSSRQYLYESLLSPSAFIASGCPGIGEGSRCESPSTMPFYGEVMSRSDMADLLEFLLSNR